MSVYVYNNNIIYLILCSVALYELHRMDCNAQVAQALVALHGLHSMSCTALVALHGLQCIRCTACVAMHRLHCMGSGCTACVAMHICCTAWVAGLGSSTVDQVLKYTKYPKYILSTSTGQVLIFLKST